MPFFSKTEDPQDGTESTCKSDTKLRVVVHHLMTSDLLTRLLRWNSFLAMIKYDFDPVYVFQVRRSEHPPALSKILILKFAQKRNDEAALVWGRQLAKDQDRIRRAEEAAALVARKREWGKDLSLSPSASRHEA